MGFWDEDDFNDFFDMMDDLEMLDEYDRKQQCKRKCPDYKSCRANFKKCKYKKKKKGWLLWIMN